MFAVCFVIFCVLSLGLVFFLGQDFFPQVDAGLIRLHFRARPGLRVEETARLCDEVERVLRSEIPKEELQTVLDNIGLPYSSINLSYSSSGVIGTSDAEILIALNPEHHHPTAEYIRRLRRELAGAFSGRGVFLPACRYRVADSELWIAGSGRYSDHGRGHAQRITISGRGSPTGCA